MLFSKQMGFPDSSVGKESTCNAGDPSLIPRLGRSIGEGIGYPLQYSWTSLLAQLVKNVPAKQETWVWSLGWEDPLEEGMAIHFSILAWRIPMDSGTWQAIGRGVTKELDTTEWLSTAQKIIHNGNHHNNLLFYLCFTFAISIFQCFSASGSKLKTKVHYRFLVKAHFP